MQTPALEPFTMSGPAGRLTGWTSGKVQAQSLLPILFIHPINLAGICWAEIVSRLEPSRFCLLLDLRGHGGSDASPPYGINAWAEDCVAVLNHFNMRQVHIVGGSLGGPLATVLAAQAPERVVSIAAFGSALQIASVELAPLIEMLDEKGVQETFRVLIPTLSVAPNTPPDLIERIVQIVNPNDAKTVTAILEAALRTDVREAARKVRCPALVVTGEHDKTCLPEQGATMAKALGTELVFMPGIGHLPMLEAPEETAALISQHLARHDHGVRA